jgi:hypothetical protein
MASRKCANCKKWLAAGQYTCRYCNRGEQDLRGDVKAANLAKLRACFAGTETVDEAALVLLLAPWAAGETLPETLCGETVAWGQSAALLDAVVKKGCATVSDACMAQQVAWLKRREEEAAELEKQLVVDAEAVRQKVLHAGDVAEKEKEHLATLRSRIATLRDTSFLRHALATCKVEEGGGLADARALLVRANERAKVAPKTEVVLARPSVQRETFEETKDKVGTNDEVRALRERTLESSQDDLDEWCGDETAEKEPVLEAEITLDAATGVLKVAGSLVPCVKSASVHCMRCPATLVDLQMKKLGGVYSVKLPPDLELRVPVTVTLALCWFPKVMFQEYAIERVAVPIESVAFGRVTRLAFAAPFKKTANLIQECVEVMHNPGSGSAVTHELLITRLAGAMDRLLDGGDAERQRRHLCTLFSAHRCFTRMLHLGAGYARGEEAYRHLYVSPHSRTFGLVDYFLARLDTLVRPGLNWSSLRTQMWIGMPFSGEFDRAIAAEHLNVSVTAPACPVVDEQLRVVLQAICDKFVSPAIAECLHPLLSGVAVQKVTVVRQPQQFYRFTHEAVMEHCVEQAVRRVILVFLVLISPVSGFFSHASASCVLHGPSPASRGGVVRAVAAQRLDEADRRSGRG